MNIHQVSVSYVQEQDRLLIRINGKDGGGELRAWLTRRLALNLMPILSRTAANQMKKVAAPVAPVASLEDQRAQLLSAFEKEASLRTGDFNTPYQERGDQPGDPILNPEPLLLTEVKVTLMSDARLRLQMFEKMPEHEATRHFQVTMDAQLSNALLQLLHQGLSSAQWLQTPVLPAMEELASISEPSELAELAVETAKPKYLN